MRNNNSLALVSACILAGAVAGSVAAIFAADGTELAGFFSVMAENAKAGELRNSFLRTLIPSLLWPLLIFIFSFSISGIVGIPLCVFAKGFLVSYSTSAIIRAFGAKGIWLALVSMGIPNLPYVFLLLLVSTLALRLSAGATAKEPKGFYIARFAVTAVIFTGLAAYQAFVQPRIITWLILKT